LRSDDIRDVRVKALERATPAEQHPTQRHALPGRPQPDLAQYGLDIAAGATGESRLSFGVQFSPLEPGDRRAKLTP
jgi:hypothetical protein